ncbi:MAG: nickel pincer cofactor biosynthesis protein LarC [Firmicutes bacterium]|nr:nickel pincer cofactor biosynthesis protein LarC [Bacillota bacterium]
MLLGALLDLDQQQRGLLADTLARTVSGLGLDPEVVTISRVTEQGIAATKVRVDAPADAELRHLPDIERILDGASLTPTVRARARKAFRRLAEVEAAVHGCRVEEIHFHEVGAVDTLVDVVGVLALVEALEVTWVGVGPVQVGGGTVEIAHGRTGVPAPATARLLEGLVIVSGPEDKELTTPTGALLLQELGARPGPMPPLVVEAVGYGGGSLKLDTGANVLRAFLGRPAEEKGVTAAMGRCFAAKEGWSEAAERVVKLETNLDQLSPEMVGHVCGVLRKEGALDVWTTSVYMKKNRPGMILSLLCRPEQEAALVEALFRHAGTLGMRREELWRWVAQREVVTVDVRGRAVAVKCGWWQGRLVHVAPEYEDVAMLARETGETLQAVMREAEQAARQALASRTETP